jgi:hypothetical protein
MFEREDGLVIHVSEDLSSTIVVVDAFEVHSNEKAALQISFVEYNNLFRYNSDLMNPNKKHERYAWIAERIYLDKFENGTSACLQDACVSKLCSSVSANDFKLPVGRLGFTERQRLRDAVTGKEMTRAKNLLLRENSRHAGSLAHISGLKQEKAKLEVDRRQHIVDEEAEREKNRNEEILRNQAIVTLREQLDKLRETRISERKLHQSERMNYRILKILVEAKKRYHDREMKSIERRAEREASILRLNSEKEQVTSSSRRLEEKREKAFREREERWAAKAENYLLAREEQLRKKERAKTNLSEKKKAQLHSLFGPIK